MQGLLSTVSHLEPNVGNRAVLGAIGVLPGRGSGRSAASPAELVLLDCESPKVGHPLCGFLIHPGPP